MCVTTRDADAGPENNAKHSYDSVHLTFDGHIHLTHARTRMPVVACAGAPRCDRSTAANSVWNKSWTHATQSQSAILV
jgi:hypothetical protein